MAFAILIKEFTRKIVACAFLLAYLFIFKGSIEEENDTITSMLPHQGPSSISLSQKTKIPSQVTGL